MAMEHLRLCSQLSMTLVKGKAGHHSTATPRFVDDVDGDGSDDLVGFVANATLVYQFLVNSYADIFAFTGDFFGQDTITDFDDGLDQIDLSDTFFTYADLAITSINGGADTLIDAGLTNITLTGISSVFRGAE